MDELDTLTLCEQAAGIVDAQARFDYLLAATGGDRDEALSLLRRVNLSLQMPAAFENTAPKAFTAGNYYFKEQIGSGAHSEVWIAERLDMSNLDVCVKVFRKRFTSKLAQLGHYEIVRTRSVFSNDVVVIHTHGTFCGYRGEDTERYFIEMALCCERDPKDPAQPPKTAKSLEKLEKAEPIDAARIFERVARTTQEAHNARVVHGDLKPENILLKPFNGTPVLADFGISTALAATDTEASPETEAATPGFGTLEYMPPECRRGKSPTVQSDIYCLAGSLLYFITKDYPHGEKGIRERVEVPETIPKALREVLQKALRQKDAHYETAADFADDLLAFVEKRPTSLSSQSSRLTMFLNRHRMAASLSVAALFVVFALGSVAAIYSARADATLARLETVRAKAAADLAEKELASRIADERAAAANRNFNEMREKAAQAEKEARDAEAAASIARSDKTQAANDAEKARDVAKNARKLARAAEARANQALADKAEAEKAKNAAKSNAKKAIQTANTLKKKTEKDFRKKEKDFEIEITSLKQTVTRLRGKLVEAIEEKADVELASIKQQEKQEKANADLKKANADLKKANADLKKANADLADSTEVVTSAEEPTVISVDTDVVASVPTTATRLDNTPVEVNEPAERETPPSEPETPPSEPETPPSKPETPPSKPETPPSEPAEPETPPSEPAEPETPPSEPAEPETLPSEPVKSEVPRVERTPETAKASEMLRTTLPAETEIG